MSLLHRLSSSRVHFSPPYIAACVAASQLYHVESREELNPEASRTTTKCNASDTVTTSYHEAGLQNNDHNRQLAGKINLGSSSQRRILASSPANISSPQPNIPGSLRKAKSQECDYVVIGHGHAGQSAVRTLKALDPSAKIIIIDPNNVYRPSGNGTKSIRRNRGNVQHLPVRATFIRHSEKVVQVSPYSSHESEAQASTIHYRKSVLLATGSRGAPPPEECISVDSKSRILELRSTSFASHRLGNTAASAKTQHFPVLDPATVRNLSLMAASQGATVAVMGSGFEALELAASLARAPQSQSKTNKNYDEDEKKILLLFGNPGPLSSRLPRYLSAAISKRLRQCGIDVEDRSMTRYLSMQAPHHNSDQNTDEKPTIPRLEIYTVKSYDRLDSRRMVADLLVLAPSVGGLNGTAVLPTNDNVTTEKDGNNYQPWSSLVSPSLITCYLEDGRVMTNAEFLAASSIYAAGSAAKYPNGRTGQADVAGGDNLSAELSGEIAARNMVKEALSGKKNKHQNELMSPLHVQETIPVWRSDQVSYLPSMSRDDGTDSITQPASSLALYSMGIHALCVGKCDSTAMATHGFWWTNTNSQASDIKSTDRNSNGTRDNTENVTKPNTFMRRMTRKATNPMSRSSFSRGGSLPVYGSGVVFYLDQCGSIQGVMLWGLPFTKNASDVQSEINNLLVKRMKEVIRTNGGISIRDHSDNIAKDSYGVSVDVDLLSYLHLSEESKFLADMALTGEQQDGDIFKPKIVLGKPLHRYTPWKPSELTNLGKVRRKDADDLFYSSSTAGISSHLATEEQGRPPSLKRIYTMQGERIDSQPSEGQLLEERSRPPKEEPLWLRQHEEMRFTNKKEADSSAFIRNMLSGQFSDGSEAVKQAPVPQLYIDAKEQLRLWKTDIGEEEEDEESE